MAAWLNIVQSETQRFSQAEEALTKGRPNILDVHCDRPLKNPWKFPPSFTNFFSPAASERNFFIIHEHDATAYHWDLRLQCSYVYDQDGTLSWAVPRGFSNWKPNEKRLAVQTPLHGISYSTFEGVSPPFGSTLISDFGTYSIKTSVSARAKGKDRERATPERDHEDDDDENGRGEERALADGFARHAFVIELKGMRYTMRLSLTFRQGAHDSKGVQKRSWIAQLAPAHDGSYLYEDTRLDLENASILSGRIMKEVWTAGGSLYSCRDPPIFEDLEGITLE